MNWVRKRRSVLSKVALLSVVAAFTILGSIGTAQAQVGGSQGASGLISLDLVDADLSKVVLALAKESNRNIIVADQDLKQKKVSATLKNVPLETALRYIVESVGCSWNRGTDGVYIISSKPMTQSLSTPAQDTSVSSVPLTDDLSTSQGRLLSDDNYVARRESKVESISLYNMSPVDMMWTLGLYQLEDMDKARAKDPSKVLYGVYNQNQYGELSPLVPGYSTPPLTESLRSNQDYYAQRTPGFPDEAGQGAPGAPPGYGGGRGNTANRPGQPGQPSGAPGTSAQGTAGLLPEGIDYIMPYLMDNSLIVRGDQEGIEELKAIISKLDVAPKQIMIKAEFVSISTGELESLGINWSLERLNSTVNTSFTLAGPISVGLANGNVMAALRAQLKQDKGKLVNAPIITTINNVPATINFNTSVPYTSSQVVVSTTGVPTTSYVTSFIQVSSFLWVTPRVNNADNSITCQIMPQISDIEKFVDTPNGTAPLINMQSVNTIRRISNGETIVLGGLIRKQDTTSVDKIPLLGDLPLVGPLFRSTNKTTDDKELLIFLTPSIIPEKPIGGTGVGVVTP